MPSPNLILCSPALQGIPPSLPAAVEGRPRGIRVYAVALGAVETRLLRGLFSDFPREQTLAPDEVAELVAGLAAEPMRHTSGQTLFVRK